MSETAVIKTTFDGSRRLSNFFWAIAVSLGGLGFFFTGLSSYLKIDLLFFSDSSGISFIPQGIVLLFLWDRWCNVGNVSNTNNFLERWFGLQ